MEKDLSKPSGRKSASELFLEVIKKCGGYDIPSLKVWWR